MSSPSQKNTSPFNIFKGFSRKQKKTVNVAVIGGKDVGKSGRVLHLLLFGPLPIQIYTCTLGQTLEENKSLKWKTLNIFSRSFCGPLPHPAVHRLLQLQRVLRLSAHCQPRQRALAHSGECAQIFSI